MGKQKAAASPGSWGLARGGRGEAQTPYSALSAQSVRKRLFTNARDLLDSVLEV